tara:strand:+ start:354 stop:569 length:216 start_codon:yes stop_codon:yes gene_type:complete
MNNWIEIDRFLRGLIDTAKSEEQLYADAMKKFSWNNSQAEAAIRPLLKRNYIKEVLPKTVKNTPKRTTKRK